MPPERLQAAGLDGTGRLDAWMLDPRVVFDGLVRPVSGNTVATVKKALIGIRDRFHVDLDGGEDLTVKGNIVVALVQGALGGVILWLLGIGAPVLVEQVGETDGNQAIAALSALRRAGGGLRVEARVERRDRLVDADGERLAGTDGRGRVELVAFASALASLPLLRRVDRGGPLWPWAAERATCRFVEPIVRPGR